MPSVSIRISGNGTPTFQRSYTLYCIVDPPRSLAVTMPRYSWLKSEMTLSKETTNELMFDELLISNNNTEYKCHYMASSQYLTSPVVVTSTTYRLIIKSMQVIISYI